MHLVVETFLDFGPHAISLEYAIHFQRNEKEKRSLMEGI